MGTLASGSMLVSIDVGSLCTGVPREDGVAACCAFLGGYGIRSCIATDVPVLIDFILEHNAFAFSDKCCLQTNGTAVGAGVAPAYAIIFMVSVGNSFLSPFPLRPTVCYGCVDGVFVVWAHGIGARHSVALHVGYTLYMHVLHCFFDELVEINGNSATCTAICHGPADGHAVCIVEAVIQSVLDFSVAKGCVRTTVASMGAEGNSLIAS